MAARELIQAYDRKLYIAAVTTADDGSDYRYTPLLVHGGVDGHGYLYCTELAEIEGGFRDTEVGCLVAWHDVHERQWRVFTDAEMMRRWVEDERAEAAVDFDALADD